MSIIEIRELTFQWPRQATPLLDIPSLIINKGEKSLYQRPQWQWQIKPTWLTSWN